MAKLAVDITAENSLALSEALRRSAEILRFRENIFTVPPGEQVLEFGPLVGGMTMTTPHGTARVEFRLEDT